MEFKILFCLFLQILIMDTNKKGGFTKLIQIVKDRFPAISDGDCRYYIKKVRVNNGGSLTGLKMGNILKLMRDC